MTNEQRKHIALAKISEAKKELIDVQTETNKLYGKQPIDMNDIRINKAIAFLNKAIELVLDTNK